MSGLKKYWSNLPARDQRVLTYGGLAVLAILLYTLIWAPLQDQLKLLRPQVVSKSADLAWMEQQANTIRKLNSSPSAKIGVSKQPILTLVDQTAKAQKIRDRIKQIQPGKESGTAKLWFDKVVFKDWLRWLDKITAQDIDVTRVSITKSAEFPRVNIRLELEGKL
ncbi:MAG: type II secretion system protein M [Pseudomonadota bacterium]|nr:type II secretion system protein M [Pseudomonadota bacterium]